MRRLLLVAAVTLTVLVGSACGGPFPVSPPVATATWAPPPSLVGGTVEGAILLEVVDGVTGTRRPIEGAAVYLMARCEPSMSAFYLNPRESDAMGRAKFDAPRCPSGSTTMTITIYRIDSDPPIVTMPPPQTVALVPERADIANAVRSLLNIT